MLKAPAYYTEFVPHIERINFDHPIFDELTDVAPSTDEQLAKCKVAANYITKQLLGVVHKPPFYYKEKEFKNINPLFVELEILRKHMRDNFADETIYGEMPYVHGLRALRLMFPSTDITPPLADITYLAMGAFRHRRKYLHLLGSMDAGKSSSTARLAWLFMAIDPDNTFVTSGSPLDKSAQMTIFGDLVELGKEIRDTHPISEPRYKESSLLFPDCRINRGKQINVTTEGILSKAGWMQHRSLKTEGIGIGAKGVGSDKRFGVGLYIVDEVNRTENFENFRRDLVNASKQEYFQMQTSQNPTDENNVGGALCTPKIWRGWGYATFDDVRENDPFMWPTVKSGIAYRLDGLKSVNLDHRLRSEKYPYGKVIYPYLFKPHQLQDIIEDEGEDSPVFASQVCAMFPGIDSANTLLTKSQLAASKHDEEDYTITKILGRFLSCDPAHTGFGDKAVIVSGFWCDAIVHNIDGTREQKKLVIIDRKAEYVKYVNGFYWEEYSSTKHGEPELNLFYDRYRKLGQSVNNLTIGTAITYEQQIALRMAELGVEYGIPKAHMIYDSSMRSGMTEAVTMIVGFEPEAMPLKDKPVGYQLKTRKKNTDEFRNANSECLYLASDLVAAKLLRGGANIPNALIQLSRRHIDLKGEPENKDDFKKRNENRSPDEGDAFAYAIWKIHRLGFYTSSPFDKQDQSGETWFSLSKKSKVNRRKTFNRPKL